MGTLTFLPTEAGTGPASPARHREDENQVPSRERAQTKLEVDNREFTATTAVGLRSLAKSRVSIPRSS